MTGPLSTALAGQHTRQRNSGSNCEAAGAIKACAKSTRSSLVCRERQLGSTEMKHSHPVSCVSSLCSLSALHSFAVRNAGTLLLLTDKPSVP